MAQLINEAKRFQKLAGIVTESSNMNFDKIALDHSNTTPNTPPGATPGTTPNKTNEGKYPSIPHGTNLKTHGRIDLPYELSDTDIDKFIEAIKSPNNPNPKVYVDRDSRESSIDGQVYEYTTVVDALPPNAGGKSGEEMKKIADSLGFKSVRGSDMKESSNIEQAVNEALRKFRKGK